MSACAELISRTVERFIALERLRGKCPRVIQEERKPSWGTDRKFGTALRFGGGGGKEDLSQSSA